MNAWQRIGVEGERYEKVETFHLNPKSITMGQLYGEFDENTHEWQVRSDELIPGKALTISRSCDQRPLVEVSQSSRNIWRVHDGKVAIE